jgi:hypothetical protein
LLYLIEPKWIWVSSGIIVPILIHLAKGRSGKTLRIGSIHLLRENIISQSSSFKIRERLLLILRCLGIVLAAIFLCSPAWKHPFSSDKNIGWVILEKNRTARSLGPFRVLVDSLLSAGFELHLLENDFPKTRIGDIDTLSKDSTGLLLPSYWELLKKLEQRIPATMPLYVFTGNKLSRFSGNRPELSLNLHWTLLETPDTITSWMSSAFSTTPDSVRVLRGLSRNSGTWFKPDFLNKQMLDKTTSGQNLISDSSTTVIGIFSVAGNPDAGYLQTALDAVRFYTHRRLNVFRTYQKDSILQKADWVFWLSDAPIPGWIHPKNIFLYKSGAYVATHSWIYPVSRMIRPELAVYRVVMSKKDSTVETIWSDGFGRPLLTLAKKENQVYSFFSRIDPDWNDLPWSAYFPRFILHLIYPENWTTLDQLNDQRKISASQAAPVFHAEDRKMREKIFQQIDLSAVCWVLLFVIFSLERILSWKTRNVIHD